MKPIYFLLIIIFITSSTCEKVEDEENQKDLYLYASYSNPPDGNPSLVADLDFSSTKINIEEEPILSEENGRIYFNYSAVTFKENKDVYIINSLETERKHENGWIVDDENFLNWSFSKSLDIIIVLDVSSSLGDNIYTVKQNAKQIVSNILSKNDEAKIGILKFSRGSLFEDLSSSETNLHSFIDESSIYNSPDIGTYELEGRSETALYETINEAIEILNSSEARGKGILTFTDGLSNFQFDPQFYQSDSIINKLKNSNISNYTIGFIGNQGTIDKQSLENISINGNFSFPQSLEELNNVFLWFSNSVAAVYDLIYETNNSKFEGIQEYRFAFDTDKISN